MDNSLKFFLQVVEEDETHTMAHDYITVVLSRKGKLNEALNVADKMVGIDPDWYTFMRRASIKQAMGDFEGAETDRAFAWKLGHNYQG